MNQDVISAKLDTVLKKWSVQVGDHVERGDTLCIVVLGKMNREVCSKSRGIVSELLFQENENIPGGAPVCRLTVEDEVREMPSPASAGPAAPAGQEVEVKLLKISGKAAVVKKWYKAVGDPVQAGEALLSVTAGKLTCDVVSPCGGTLGKIAVPAESAVQKGDVLGYVVSNGVGSPAESVGPSLKVLVVGGGPGGYVAAIRAAQLGAEVTLVEREHLGGTCLNVGCIPTKALLHSAETYLAAKNSASIGIAVKEAALDWSQVQANRRAVSRRLTDGVSGLLAANGVTVVKGTAEFVKPKVLRITGPDGDQEVSADRVILATGSEPVMPPIPGLEGNPNCIDSTGALTLADLPASMVIIGGGVIGVELACAYAAFGTRVTVVEMMPRILPLMDYELTLEAQHAMEEQGISFFLETQVQRFEAAEAGVRVLTKRGDGSPQCFEAEKVLVAVGRRSHIASLNPEAAGIQTERGHITVNDRLETSVKGIYAIGDCAGRIMLAHTASAMGEIAAENAVGLRKEYSERVCPSCVYMFPEFACVGLNEEELKSRKIDYKAGRFPLAANGKSVIMDKTRGMVKILADAKSGEILGVHILGARATDLIAEAAMAMRLHAKAADIAETIHAHPTVAEALKEAALSVEDRAIHFK